MRLLLNTWCRSEEAVRIAARIARHDVHVEVRLVLSRPGAVVLVDVHADGAEGGRRCPGDLLRELIHGGDLLGGDIEDVPRIVATALVGTSVGA